MKNLVHYGVGCILLNILNSLCLFYKIMAKM